ncbi:MAG: type II toxin-antitoxin system Phd/YefM family antitoxin [Oscillospiraceae bacterium]|nr:type II toxin-antitoxin system Phd/YefM family antitoxin [Oscillospiraceae bacterium]
MEFVTSRELSTEPRQTWERLSQAGELVITNNGKPTAVLVSIDDGKFEETIKLIRQVKDMRLLQSVWAEAEARGTLNSEEINAEIAAARVEMRADV